MKPQRKTLHSASLSLGDKTFYLDLKEAVNGRQYLVITQSKSIEEEKYERIKMILFQDDIPEFADALSSVLEYYTPMEDPKTMERDAYIAKLRQRFPMAYLPWTKEDEESLTQLFKAGKSFAELSKAMQRQEGAVKARLTKLGLIETASAA
jgi:hypothetical protein